MRPHPDAPKTDQAHYRQVTRLQRHARVAADLLLRELDAADETFEVADTQAMCDLHRLVALLRITGKRGHLGRDTADARLRVALRWPSVTEAYEQLISDLIGELHGVHDKRLDLLVEPQAPAESHLELREGGEIRPGLPRQQPAHRSMMQPCRLCGITQQLPIPDRTGPPRSTGPTEHPQPRKPA